MKIRPTWKISLLLLSASAVALLYGYSELRPILKYRQLAPVLTELNVIREQNATYPPNASSLALVGLLSRKYTFYFGERTPQGLTWNAQEVSDHDFTILTEGRNLILFMPSGKIKLYSFSSFQVYCYTTVSHKWERGRIHWSFLGTYWDPH